MMPNLGIQHAFFTSSKSPEQESCAPQEPFGTPLAKSTRFEHLEPQQREAARNLEGAAWGGAALRIPNSTLGQEEPHMLPRSKLSV